MVRLLEPLELSKEAAFQQIAQTCWEVFEPTIRQHPEQWLWLHKHWRYRPVEGAGRYPFYANNSEKFESELADALFGSNRAANPPPDTRVCAVL
jgi:Kdo2-lipid IVA lauroyltransferase/acyltransferase